MKLKHKDSWFEYSRFPGICNNLWILTSLPVFFFRNLVLYVSNTLYYIIDLRCNYFLKYFKIAKICYSLSLISAIMATVAFRDFMAFCYFLHYLFIQYKEKMYLCLPELLMVLHKIDLISLTF